MREQIIHRTGRLPLRIYQESYADCHWHDEFEFVLPLDEPCQCLIDAQPITVCVGEALLIHSKQLHTLHSKGKFYAVVFHPIGVCGQDMLEFFSPDRQFRTRLDHHDADLIETLHALCNTPQTYGCELLLRSYILSLLGRMIQRGYYDEASPPHPFLQVLSYTRDHACEHGLSLAMVARATFFSPFTVSHAFRQYTGMTFSEFVMDCRLNKACELLGSTKRSVLDIALDCGFNNVSYFIKCFKKRFGKTPHQYRI
jgi:AraC-like DNA-binding protein